MCRCCGGGYGLMRTDLQLICGLGFAEVCGKRKVFIDFYSKYDILDPWGIGAAGSAPHWQCGGHGFESRMLHFFMEAANRRFSSKIKGLRLFSRIVIIRIFNANLGLSKRFLFRICPGYFPTVFHCFKIDCQRYEKSRCFKGNAASIPMSDN